MLLVLHGLTGGSAEGYVKSLCAHGTSRGFRAAAVVYRGCGGLRLTSARPYGASFTADISRAAQQARREFPLASSLVAVGFSLGAIILSKYLGEQDAGYWHHGRGGGGGGEDDDLIDAAVAVSSPFCLESAGAKLSRPWTGD